jgi:lipoprotein-anchoring transpeptidase ErfK/SrfK
MRHARARVRYKRLTAAGSACAVTLVAVAGGIGLLPAEEGTRPVARATLSSAEVAKPVRAKAADEPARARDDARFRGTESVRATLAAAALEVPPDSGQGRRVVFDMSAQRVWLVGGDDAVRRTYPVSGSLDDNLKPGSYEVYSRSERAWGIDDSGTMRYMVRFAHGSRAAIGFHDIPVKDGRRVQTRAELGTPQSHGCIRQWRPDAEALWDFAPVGTSVVVVA